MLFLRKTTLAAGLIGATMAGGLALAAVDGVPNFNVEPSFRAAAQPSCSPASKWRATSGNCMAKANPPRLDRA